MHRDFPDAEEAQHVVNSVGVEILSHLLEAANPPLVAIFGHLVPVVGGESPVLPILREVIWWCSCLSVEIKQVRLCPCFHAVSGDADGDVALDDDTLLSGLHSHSQELLVQLILYIIEESHLLLMLFHKNFHIPCVILAILGPFSKVCCLELIAQIGEHGVGNQPVLVVVEEGLEILLLHHFLPLLLIRHSQVFHLQGNHLLIVNLLQGIQFLLLHQELLHRQLVLQPGQSIDVAIERMESIDADGVVRVGILPLARHHCVVDGQNLDGVHLRLHHPLDERLQVAKVTHTITLGRAEREHRNHHACHLPAVAVQVRPVIRLHPHLFGRQTGATQSAVLPLFPTQDMVLVVHHHIFIFSFVKQHVSIDVHSPFLQVDKLHRFGTLPFAQLRRTPTQRQPLALPQPRFHHTQLQGRGVERVSSRLTVRAIMRVQVDVGQREQRQVLRDGTPLVAQYVLVRDAVESHLVRRHLPFRPHELVITIHGILVLDALYARVLERDFTFPQFSVVSVQAVLLHGLFISTFLHLAELHPQVLPPLGIVFDAKTYFHYLGLLSGL